MTTIKNSSTVKSAKVSMLVFTLHFAKINAIASIKHNIKNAFIPMFKCLSLFALWALPLYLNYDMRYSTKFNVYYLFASVIIGLLAIVIHGVKGDMEHAVYLNSKKYELSRYYRMLVKIWSLI